MTNETFTVTIRFTEDVRGFTLSDINVRNGSTASSLDEVTDDRRYEVDIEPTTRGRRTVTVTIRAGAVESISTSQDNVATSEDFPVDTEAPELDDATVDENDLVLTYDEPLDESSEPDPDDLRFEVDGSNVTSSPSRSGRGSDPDSQGPRVEGRRRVTTGLYTPSNDPIQDELGNEAELLTTRTGHQQHHCQRTTSRAPHGPEGDRRRKDENRFGLGRAVTMMGGATSPATGSSSRLPAAAVGTI